MPAAVQVGAAGAEQVQVVLRRHPGLVQVRGGLIQGQGKIAEPLCQLPGQVISQARHPAAQQGDRLGTVKDIQVDDAADRPELAAGS